MKLSVILTLLEIDKSLSEETITFFVTLRILEIEESTSKFLPLIFPVRLNLFTGNVFI